MAVGGRVLLASYTSRLPHEEQFFIVSGLFCLDVSGLYQCCFDAKDPISFCLGKGIIVLLNTVFVRGGQSVFFNNAEAGFLLYAEAGFLVYVKAKQTPYTYGRKPAGFL